MVTGDDIITGGEITGVEVSTGAVVTCASVACAALPAGAAEVTGAGLPGGGQHAGGFSPSRLVLGVEAGVEERGEREQREEGGCGGHLEDRACS